MFPLGSDAYRNLFFATGVVEGYRAHAQSLANAIKSETSAQKLLEITPLTVEQWLSETGV